MIRRCPVTAFAVVALLWAAVAAAQDRDRFRGRRPPSRGEFLQRMDANGNGLLEPDEVPERARSIIDSLAERAGLDPAKPLPIQKIVSVVESGRGRRFGSSRGFSRGARGETDGGAPGDDAEASSPAAHHDEPQSAPADSNQPDAADASADAGKSAAPDAPSVPGFGSDEKLALVPGFEPQTSAGSVPGFEDAAAAEAGSSAAAADAPARDAGSRSGSSASAPLDADVRAKIERYAESLLKQYDENRNGVLERSEWEKMRGGTQRADANKDGRITLTELTEHLVNYANRSRGARSTSSTTSGGTSRRSLWPGRSQRTGSDTVSRGPVARRFLTPPERLPEGLPEWFIGRDRDGDGQVSMAEYAGSWNDAKAAEFATFDQNNDGLITPAECLATQQK